MTTHPARGYVEHLISTLRKLPFESLQQIVGVLREVRRRDGCVFVMGNGGSAATACHLACDLSKSTVRCGVPRLRTLTVVDNVSLVTAWANDTGYENVFVRQLENLASSGDVVIAISGSGRSENVLRAARWARERGMTTIGFVGFEGGNLKDLVDIAVVVDDTNIGRIEDVHHALGHMLTEALSEPEETW